MTEMNLRPSISYQQLGIIAAAFSVGLLVGLFSLSATGSSQTTLTPMALVGFVLSILLGGASIVLAVVAIYLGKSSETALIARGDESVRLQTEIYTKTTDALQRIASSTDVTEKRIEDIINGRVGDISHDLARTLSTRGRQSPEHLEENIRRSIAQSMRSQETEAAKIKAKEDEKEREELYQEAHKKTLIAFANRGEVKISKIEHGNIKEDGEDLFDGLYEANGRKIALSTFRPDWSSNDIKPFVISAAKQIKSGVVGHVVIILFRHGEMDSRATALQETIDLFPPELQADFSVLECAFNEAEDVIAKLEVSNKMLDRSGGPTGS